MAESDLRRQFWSLRGNVAMLQSLILFQVACLSDPPWGRSDERCTQSVWVLFEASHISKPVPIAIPNIAMRCSSVATNRAIEQCAREL
jgi:hypothetical protein